MSNLLDYRQKSVAEAMDDFEALVESIKTDGTSEDYTVVTDNHDVQGALLEFIDGQELEHVIELGGKIHVTVS